MEANEKLAKAPQQTSIATATTSTTVYKEPHVLDRPPYINLATPFKTLDVLCESLVDFDNMKLNGVDLTEKLKKQGWETYFQRLYGPIYTFFSKEFWRFIDCDDHCIVPHVLGVKMVIIEKYISKLLNMEKTGGRRIYNINPRARYNPKKFFPLSSNKALKADPRRTRNFTRI